MKNKITFKDVMRDLAGLILIVPLIIVIYIWAGIEWLREIKEEFDEGLTTQ